MAEGIVAKLLLEWGNKQNPDDEEGGLISKLLKDSGKRLKIAQRMMKTSLGMNFSMGAILKQSQVFTGTMGALFQVMGAMVDVFLMPLVPYVLPLIKTLAKTIPIIRRTSQAVVDFIAGAFKKFGDGIKTIFGWMGIDGGGFSSMMESVGKFLVSLLATAFMLKVSGVWMLAKVFFKPAMAVVKVLGRGLNTILMKMFPATWTFIKNLPKLAWAGFKSGLSKFFSPITQFIVTFTKNIGSAMGKALKFLTNPGAWFGKLIAKLSASKLGLAISSGLKSLKGFFTGWLDDLFKVLGKYFPKLAGIGGAIGAKLGMGSAGGVIGKVGAKLAGKSGLKTAAKFIPFLGAAVTAGFAAKDTFDTFKEKGVGAGLVRGGIGLAQTGLAMGGPLGVGASIGLDLFADKIVDKLTGQTTVKVEVGQGMEAIVQNERTGAMQTASFLGENQVQ